MMMKKYATITRQQRRGDRGRNNAPSVADLILKKKASQNQLREELSQENSVPHVNMQAVSEKLVRMRVMKKGLYLELKLTQNKKWKENVKQKEVTTMKKAMVLTMTSYLEVMNLRIVELTLMKSQTMSQNQKMRIEEDLL